MTINVAKVRIKAMLRYINIFVGLVVAIAIYFLFFAYSTQPKSAPKATDHLKKVIPASLDGWTSKDIPLGPNEEAVRAAEKILGSNEYFNKEYTSSDGTKSFVVYIAYWEAGKANGRVVTDHTPDKCWILNGWENDKSKARSDVVLKVDDMKLIPAFYRRMIYKNFSTPVERFVCFWHMMDGERYDYGDSATFFNAFSFEYLKNVLLSTFRGAPEQYFIRVDSSQDILTLKEDKEFQKIIKALGKLILEDKGEAKK